MEQGRTRKDLLDYIEQEKLQAVLIDLPVNTPTVEAAADALGVEVGLVVKSLLFWVGIEPVLVIARGMTRVDRRVVARAFGVGRKKVKLMPAQDALELSGYPVGAVPPFGLLIKPKAIMDATIVDEAQVFAGGGAQNTLMQVSPEEIHRVASAQLIDFQIGENG